MHKYLLKFKHIFNFSLKDLLKIDRKTILKRKFLERSALQWLELILFYIVFYIFVGGFFMLHIIIYLQIIGHYTLPQNAGYNLGYTNYPNNQLFLSSNPQKITINLKKLTGNSFITNHSTCMNLRESQDVLSIYSKSLQVYVNKVVEWRPEIINATYKNNDVLEMNCSLADNKHNITVEQCSRGLPLNLNNTNGRSYPYTNNADFVRPKMTVLLHFQHFNSKGMNNYRIQTSIRCSIEACKHVSSYHCPPVLAIPIIITDK